MRRLAKAFCVLLAAIACAAVFGVGVPLFWVWLGARFQSASGPNSGVSMVTVAIVILGPLASYLALIVFASRFRFSQPADAAPRPPRRSWTRSRDEIRQEHRSSTFSTFERIVLTAILIVGLGFEVWFFFFAHCASEMCYG